MSVHDGGRLDILKIANTEWNIFVLLWPTIDTTNLARSGSISGDLCTKYLSWQCSIPGSMLLSCNQLVEKPPRFWLCYCVYRCTPLRRHILPFPAIRTHGTLEHCRRPCHGTSTQQECFGASITDKIGTYIAHFMAKSSTPLMHVVFH